MIVITQTFKSFSSHYSACRSLYVYATILDWDIENRALIKFCIAFVLFKMRCDMNSERKGYYGTTLSTLCMFSRDFFRSSPFGY